MILIFLFFALVAAHDAPQPQTQSHIILTEFAAELTDWVGFPGTVLDAAAACRLPDVEQQLLELHSKLAKEGSDFSKAHLHIIKSFLQEH